MCVCVVCVCVCAAGTLLQLQGNQQETPISSSNLDLQLGSNFEVYVAHLNHVCLLSHLRRTVRHIKHNTHAGMHTRST